MFSPRLALTSALALALAACGGDDSNNSVQSPPPSSSPAPSPAPAQSPSALEQQLQFADDVLNEWYLYPDLLDTSFGISGFNSVQEFLDARVAPARAQDIDKGFTFATSIQEENALISSGASAGFGILLSYDTANNRVNVLEAYEAGNGFQAGIDRGTELLAIGRPGQALENVSSLMASGGPQAVVNALGPADADVTRTLRFAQADGTVITADVTKTVFNLDPISDRYGFTIFTEGSRSIAYINLRTFIVDNAEDQLDDVFAQIRAQGITELIIDFRYNGGGLVRVADKFGDLMGAGNVGRVWSETVLRPSKSAENETELIQAESNAIAPTKIAFITQRGTASASELVINSMLPYLDPDNIALIGANTFGKPVGQFGFDFAQFDLRVRAVTFQTNNADGNGDYFSGLAGVVPNTCRAVDDIDFPLGDAREDSIATALDFLAGRPCTAISGGDIRAQSVDTRRILQPQRPSAAQYQIPGIF